MWTHSRSSYGAKEMAPKSQLSACSFQDSLRQKNWALEQIRKFPDTSDTCGRLKTIRIRGVWTRKFSYPQNNICEKKISGYMWTHSRPQRPRSFWSAPRIAIFGPVQRHSGFEWLCKHSRLRPEPIRFVRLDSEHAQSDGKSMNRRLPVLDMARGNLVPRIFVNLVLRNGRLWGRDWARGRDSWCWPKGARPLEMRMVWTWP